MIPAQTVAKTLPATRCESIGYPTSFKLYPSSLRTHDTLSFMPSQVLGMLSVARWPWLSCAVWSVVDVVILVTLSVLNQTNSTAAKTATPFKRSNVITTLTIHLSNSSP